MAMSLAAMVVAAFGLAAARRGALLQEGIDVAVILNALRALRGIRPVEVELPTDTEQMLRRFAAEHDQLRETVGSAAATPPTVWPPAPIRRRSRR